MDDREKFWNSEESKEKERIADEKVRKKSEIKQLGMYMKYHFISKIEIWKKRIWKNIFFLDLERRAREERESKLREAAITERERKTSTLKEKEAKIDNIHSEDGKKTSYLMVFHTKTVVFSKNLRPYSLMNMRLLHILFN